MNKKQTRLACGHPVECLTQADGDRYCGWCHEVNFVLSTLRERVDSEKRMLQREKESFRQSAVIHILASYCRNLSAVPTRHVKFACQAADALVEEYFRHWYKPDPVLFAGAEEPEGGAEEPEGGKDDARAQAEVKNRKSRRKGKDDA